MLSVLPTINKIGKTQTKKKKPQCLLSDPSRNGTQQGWTQPPSCQDCSQDPSSHRESSCGRPPPLGFLLRAYRVSNATGLHSHQGLDLLFVWVLPPSTPSHRDESNPTPTSDTCPSERGISHINKLLTSQPDIHRQIRGQKPGVQDPPLTGGLKRPNPTDEPSDYSPRW